MDLAVWRAHEDEGDVYVGRVIAAGLHSLLSLLSPYGHDPVAQARSRAYPGTVIGPSESAERLAHQDCEVAVCPGDAGPQPGGGQPAELVGHGARLVVAEIDRRDGVR